MMSKDLAPQIYNFPTMLLRKVCLLQKLSVIIVRHKTDLHALLLIGGLELAMPGYVARITFGAIAQRKQSAGQLILPQGKQKVTLIFAQILPALKQDSVAVWRRFQARKMAGRDVLCAQLVGPFNQSPKFEILITHHARIRSAPSLVLSGKVLNDFGLKLFCFVNQVIRNA